VSCLDDDLAIRQLPPDAHGAALGTVAVPAPVTIPTVFMITNDDVLAIANSSLGRRGDRGRERRSYGGT
jgi:hypothetical protein